MSAFADSDATQNQWAYRVIPVLLDGTTVTLPLGWEPIAYVAAAGLLPASLLVRKQL